MITLIIIVMVARSIILLRLLLRIHQDWLRIPSRVPVFETDPIRTPFGCLCLAGFYTKNALRMAFGVPFAF